MPAIMNAYRGAPKFKVFVKEKDKTKRCANPTCDVEMALSRVSIYCDPDCASQVRERTRKRNRRAAAVEKC